MTTSTEKIAQLRAEMREPPNPDAGPAELMLRTVMLSGDSFLDQLLPTDPDDLDALLTMGVIELSKLRSDNAPPLNEAQQMLAGLLELQHPEVPTDVDERPQLDGPR